MESTKIDRCDIQDMALGNIEIIKKPELKPLEEPVVKYTIPPDLDVIGVNTPRYDCCVQKVIDEMGIYIKDQKMQFVVGNEASPRDIVQYFPKYIMYFRAGTVPGTDPGIINLLDAHIGYFHSLGLKVFYYLDDYLLNVNNRAPIQLMTNSDEIIVSTNELKDAIIAEGIKKPVNLLRTHVALNTFAMLPPMENLRTPKGFHILFSSQGRIGVMQLMRLVEKMNQYPDTFKDVTIFCLSHEVAQIRSIINKYRAIRKVYLEWLPLDMYYRLCATADVILAPGEVGDLDYMMPREQQKPWLNAKSCHKYTVAGAAGIPCIASPMRDYVEAIRQGETGFIAETDEQWIEYIKLLKENPDLKAEIGAAAKKDIEENWSIYDRTKQFAQIIRGEVKREEEAPIEIKAEEAPPVLVYVPVHNYKDYIRECLNSIVTQSYPNQQIIVSDNASTDGTREIIEKEYPNIPIIKSDTYNKIANEGLEKALAMSDCKYFITLGADDMLEPHFWETVLPYFKDPKVGFVRIGCFSFTDNDYTGVWRKPWPFNNPRDILVRNTVLITSPIRRECFDKSVKFVDHKCFFSDWDIWIQIVLDGWKWATCNQPLFRYRRHSQAWSFNFDPRQSGVEYTYMRNKWMPMLLKYGIKASAMASFDDIEEAKKNSEYANTEIKKVEAPAIQAPNINLNHYPKTLVYVPTHNSSRYIRECLDSVVSQKYKNQEIVVFDNASEDDTVSIVEKEYPMITIDKVTEFAPIASPGINKTLTARPEVKFFMTLGSDDKLCEGYWETLLPMFNSPDIGFVRIGAYQFGERNPSGTWWKPFAWHEPKELFESNKVFGSSPIRREVWEDVGGFDLEVVWGDWDFWMSAVVKGWKWNTYEKPMFWYRRHFEQDSVSPKTYSKVAMDKLKNKWLDTFKKFGVKGSMLATPEELREV